MNTCGGNGTRNKTIVLRGTLKLKQQTNADRIRAMDDEELAEWLCDIAGWLPMYEGKMHPILDWLKQEAPNG